MKTSRIDLIRSRIHQSQSQHLSHSHRMNRLNHHQLIRVEEMCLGLVVDGDDQMFDEDLKTAYIALQTKSLDDDPHVPCLVKWLLRRIYHRYGWTAMGHDGKSYCKWEFLGIFDTSTQARWAAMVPGGSWMELPLNESLPEETSQFRAHDFPRSSVSHEYRNRKLPFVSLPRMDIERLEAKVKETLDCAEGKCAKAV